MGFEKKRRKDLWVLRRELRFLLSEETLGFLWSICVKILRQLRAFKGGEMKQMGLDEANGKQMF